MVSEIKLITTIRGGSGHKSKFYMKYLGHALVLSMGATNMCIFPFKNSLNSINLCTFMYKCYTSIKNLKIALFDIDLLKIHI